MYLRNLLFVVLQTILFHYHVLVNTITRFGKTIVGHFKLVMFVKFVSEIIQVEEKNTDRNF